MQEMTEDECGKWVTKLIQQNKLEDFYNSPAWRKLRKEVLVEHKGECQDCKTKGFYKAANTVHHQQYVRNHPRLALSKTYTYQGKEYKQLVPLCHDSHEVRHGYRAKDKEEKLLTEERW